MHPVLRHTACFGSLRIGIMPATAHKPNGGPVGKVKDYHTVVPEYGDERNVYHDQSTCPAGSRIKDEHRTYGTGGRHKCDRCKDMN